MKLTGDFEKLAKLRTRLRRAATPEIRTRVARAMGEAARTRLMLGFRNSVDPYGDPWAPIRHRDGKPLLDTSRLRNSFTYTPSPDGLVIGTNVFYAKFHQYGTGGRRQAGGRSQAIDTRGKFRSHAKAGKQRGGAVAFRRLNYGVGSGAIRQRMMLPVRSRGLGTWGEPMKQAALRVVSKILRGK